MDLSENSSEQGAKQAHGTETAPQSKKELFASLDSLKSEIISCRKKLNESGESKEKWYAEKEKLSHSIRNDIESVKEIRRKRDELTKQVKELKEQRTKLNDEIKKKISEVLALKKESESLLSKSKFKNPYALKQDIEKLELKLETEDMPFDKEKELSKKLRSLKKSLEEFSGFMAVSDKIRGLNSQIAALKEDSSAVHDRIRAIAGESQRMHESLIQKSKSIDEARAKEEEAFKKFVESKKCFNEANHALKEKLGGMNEIGKKINRFKLEEDEKRKLKESSLIREKEQELEEKMRAGKKLTTEDFLLFQHSMPSRK